MNGVVSDLFQEFMPRLNRYLDESVHSHQELIGTVTYYLNSNGGKRIRPRLCYLIGSSLQCHDIDALVQVSGIIELIHCATLMHDDVVDESSLRRGVETVHARWNVPAAILIGDFIYSRSFQLVSRINNPDIVSVLADTSNLLAEGEVDQLVHLHARDVDEATYLDIAWKKTGVLFAACCQCAAILSGADQTTREAAIQLGKNTGIAFQIIDDLLDYSGKKDDTGKRPGTDYQEGKYTLPLIHLLTKIEREPSEKILADFGTDNAHGFELTCQLIEETDTTSYCQHYAEQLIEKAVTDFVACVPPSEYRDAVVSMVHESVSRKS